jgi:hypothetical protein
MTNPRSVRSAAEEFKSNVDKIQTVKMGANVDPAVVRGPEVSKIIATFGELLTDTNRKYAIVAELEDQQVHALSAMANMKASINGVNKYLLYAQALVTDFANTKQGTPSDFTTAQEGLAKNFGEMVENYKRLKGTKLPNLDGSYEHVIELSDKATKLQESIKTVDQTLSKTGELNELIHSGIKLVERISDDVQKGIVALNDQNHKIQQYIGTLPLEIKKMQAESKAVTEPLVTFKLMAQTLAKEGKSSAPSSESKSAALKKLLNIGGGSAQVAPLNNANNGSLKSK